jgi:hypothetical protein
MEKIVLGLFVLFVCPLAAQNLVTNPSFETVTSIPSSDGQVFLATGWYSAYGTCDLFHPSASSTNVTVPTNYFGVQAARTGTKYAGIATSSTNAYHEIAGVVLTTPLTIGQSYYVEAYVSVGESQYQFGTNNFGFKVASSAITGTGANPPISSPTVNWTSVLLDYTNWVQVSGTFTATAASTYLLLGNFFSTAATTWTLHGGGGFLSSQYWYIDDVLLQPSTVFAMPGHTFGARPLGSNLVVIDWEFPDLADTREFNLLRSFDGGGSWHDCMRTQAEAQQHRYTHTDRPMRWGEEMLYRLRRVKSDGSVDFSETVSAILPLPTLDESLSLSPSPLQVGQEGFATFATTVAGDAAWSLFDMAGRQLDKGKTPVESGTTQIALPTTALLPGTYLLRLQVDGQTATRKLVVW